MTNIGCEAYVVSAQSGVRRSDMVRLVGLSEHTFEGKGSDMELHLVHKSAAGDTAVVGVLVERGPSSAALAPIFGQLPDDVNMHHPLAAPFNPGRFLPADRAYYRYEGSLTTPPCTEGVHWIVLKDPITISSEDLAQVPRAHSLQRAAGAAVLSLDLSFAANVSMR